MDSGLSVLCSLQLCLHPVCTVWFISKTDHKTMMFSDWCQAANTEVWAGLTAVTVTPGLGIRQALMVEDSPFTTVPGELELLR